MNPQVVYLRTPVAIREQCGRIFALAEKDMLAHFRLRLDKLPEISQFVLDVTREAYPTLDVPYHSRWRHFDVGGVDREKLLDETLAAAKATKTEIAKTKIELAILSVLLDAGAGDGWRYQDARSGKELSRSEGLAVASFEMFFSGKISGSPEALRKVSVEDLKAGFQVSATNPLIGVEGRLALLTKLAHAIEAHPTHFGKKPRLGNLVDLFVAQSTQGELPARKILAAVIEGLGSIWPGRVSLGGVNLGDVWRHSQVTELVPFHKLSQWLSYSLCEPLEQLGIEITLLDELTGLPEYRNGGLFLDGGVLEPKHEGVFRDVHKPDSDLIVEWRALTVCLLDRTAAEIRRLLGKTALELPLAKVLQGGTWTAGRRLAAKLRAGGGPPIRYESDGTLF